MSVLSNYTPPVRQARNLWQIKICIKIAILAFK